MPMKILQRLSPDCFQDITYNLEELWNDLEELKCIKLVNKDPEILCLMIPSP